MSGKVDGPRRDEEPDEDVARIEADVERVLDKVGDVLEGA
jgi:hypothetical protein